MVTFVTGELLKFKLDAIPVDRSLNVKFIQKCKCKESSIVHFRGIHTNDVFILSDFAENYAA